MKPLYLCPADSWFVHNGSLWTVRMHIVKSDDGTLLHIECEPVIITGGQAVREPRRMEKFSPWIVVQTVAY